MSLVLVALILAGALLGAAGTLASGRWERYRLNRRADAAAAARVALRPGPAPRVHVQIGGRP